MKLSCMDGTNCIMISLSLSLPLVPSFFPPSLSLPFSDLVTKKGGKEAQILRKLNVHASLILLIPPPLILLLYLLSLSISNNISIKNYCP